jgi:hypothetical protein
MIVDIIVLMRYIHRMMRIANKHYFICLRQLWLMWQALTNVLHLMQRRDTLENLVDWAQRKRLVHVQKHYQQLLIDLENRLFWHEVRSGQIIGVARWIHCFRTQLQPSPKYYPRGYASKYCLAAE